MKKIKEFLKRKNIEFSAKRYGIDALSAMAQGLFASLLIGTILSTIGQQFNIPVLDEIGTFAKSVQGSAMAIAIGFALKCPPLVLFSLTAVGHAANALGGAGGAFAVLIITIVAAELGKAVSKETKLDILVTPIVTICSGILLAMLIAGPIGKGASAVGNFIMWATELHPFWMYYNFCCSWHSTDTSYLKCGNLSCNRAYRACRRDSSCGRLCSYGRLCRNEL